MNRINRLFRGNSSSPNSQRNFSNIHIHTPSYETENDINLNRRISPFSDSSSRHSSNYNRNVSPLIDNTEFGSYSSPHQHHYNIEHHNNINSYNNSDDNDTISLSSVTLDPSGCINEICIANITNSCKFGKHCRFIHGKPCSLCNENVYNPLEELSDQMIEHSKVCKKMNLDRKNIVKKSNEEGYKINYTCSICLENIVPPMKFGVLCNCNHYFCYECIKIWRNSQDFSDINNHLKCPLCKTKSQFLIPSSEFPKTQREHNMLIKRYKQELANTECKKLRDTNYKFCPYGDNCIYSHYRPDGKYVHFTYMTDANQFISPEEYDQNIYQNDNTGFIQYYNNRLIEEALLTDDGDDFGMHNGVFTNPFYHSDDLLGNNIPYFNNLMSSPNSNPNLGFYSPSIYGTDIHNTYIENSFNDFTNQNNALNINEYEESINGDDDNISDINDSEISDYLDEIDEDLNLYFSMNNLNITNSPNPSMISSNNNTDGRSPASVFSSIILHSSPRIPPPYRQRRTLNSRNNENTNINNTNTTIINNNNINNNNNNNNINNINNRNGIINIANNNININNNSNDIRLSQNNQSNILNRNNNNENRALANINHTNSNQNTNNNNYNNGYSNRSSNNNNNNSYNNNNPINIDRTNNNQNTNNSNYSNDHNNLHNNNSLYNNNNLINIDHTNNNQNTNSNNLNNDYSDRSNSINNSHSNNNENENSFNLSLTRSSSTQNFQSHSSNLNRPYLKRDISVQSNLSTLQHVLSQEANPNDSFDTFGINNEDSRNLSQLSISHSSSGLKNTTITPLTELVNNDSSIISNSNNILNNISMITNSTSYSNNTGNTSISTITINTVNNLNRKTNSNNNNSNSNDNSNKLIKNNNNNNNNINNSVKNENNDDSNNYLKMTGQPNFELGSSSNIINKFTNNQSLAHEKQFIPSSIIQKNKNNRSNSSSSMDTSFTNNLSNLPPIPPILIDDSSSSSSQERLPQRYLVNKKNNSGYYEKVYGRRSRNESLSQVDSFSSSISQNYPVYTSNSHNADIEIESIFSNSLTSSSSFIGEEEIYAKYYRQHDSPSNDHYFSSSIGSRSGIGVNQRNSFNYTNQRQRNPSISRSSNQPSSIITPNLTNTSSSITSNDNSHLNMNYGLNNNSHLNSQSSSTSHHRNSEQSNSYDSNISGSFIKNNNERYKQNRNQSSNFNKNNNGSIDSSSNTNSNKNENSNTINNSNSSFDMNRSNTIKFGEFKGLETDLILNRNHDQTYSYQYYNKSEDDIDSDSSGEIEDVIVRSSSGYVNYTELSDSEFNNSYMETKF